MTQIDLMNIQYWNALPGVLCNNVWPGCFPEPRSQHSKSAIGNGTIAVYTYSERFFFRRHEHGQQRLNKVILVGNLGQDPEVRYMPMVAQLPTLRWLLPNPGVIKRRRDERAD